MSSNSSNDFIEYAESDARLTLAFYHMSNPYTATAEWFINYGRVLGAEVIFKENLKTNPPTIIFVVKGYSNVVNRIEYAFNQYKPLGVQMVVKQAFNYRVKESFLKVFYKLFN